jgi:hypothetical protein
VSTVFSAHFDGQVIVPDEPLSLPIGQKLQVRIENASEEARPFANLADFAADLPDSPGDLAVEHDHYNYGTPKQNR